MSLSNKGHSTNMLYAPSKICTFLIFFPGFIKSNIFSVKIISQVEEVAN